METKTKSSKGLTIANIVLSIVFALVVISNAGFALIFNNDEAITVAFGILVNTIYQSVCIAIEIVWLIITFILLARIHNSDEGLGSKTCSVFYGITTGIICLAIIGFIISMICLYLIPNSFVPWNQSLIGINTITALTFFSSFIFSIINVKKM